MDASPKTIQTEAQGPAAFDWLPAILMVCALTFAISHQSLWLDETEVGADTMPDSMRDWWQQIFQARTTELQSPFYMLYLWVFARVFGSGEWALRGANLIWLLPGLILLVQGFRNRLDRLWVGLAVAANACIWYYAGEARPYAMLLGTSCLVFAAIHRLGRAELNPLEQSGWLSVLLVGLVLLCGTTLLGAIWSGGALLLMLLWLPRRRLWELWRAGQGRVAATGCILLGVGAYYFWTLRIGARATAFATTDWRSMGYIVYEQLGFGGLGPGRTDLRVGGVSLLRPYAPALLAYAALVGALAVRGVGELARRLSVRGLAALATAFAAPTILLLSVGMSSHWRVLGRHCIVLMPAWVTLLGFGLSGFWRGRSWIGKAAGAAFLVMALWSCASIRFAARHQRDDYRDAAQVVRAALARGGVAWWNAVSGGARYYQVPLATGAPEPGKAALLVNVPAAWLSGMEKPDVVAVSKPELFDVQGGVATYLAEHHYRPVERFAAFTIWRP